ncbi:MAG: hypothetical protein HZB53_00005 [Chloroflexi bacterium]|nr:hypothetical protein [Chloroflexota bacterium]
MFNASGNRNMLIAGAVGGIAGLLIGLIFAWMIWPVSYNPGYPPTLAQKYKDDYVQMAADSYAIDQNKATAQARLKGLESELPDIFGRLKAQAQADRQDVRAARVQKTADDLGVKITSAPATADGGGFPLQIVLGLVLLMVGGAGIAFWLYLRRQAPPAPSAPSPRVERETAATATMQAPMTVTAEAPAPAIFKPAAVAPVSIPARRDAGEPPPGHFVTTYKLGDDGYDTSFSIETPAGDFVGECGVGISDTVGDGPQKVTAFEVWLFDKNDIKTVTKVLMSDYAFNNEAIRKKLLARGDAVLVTPGQELVLETEALSVRAVVTDFGYGSGGAPASFFARLSMELAPTIKGA